MRIPALKAFPIFVAGFVSCLLCVAFLVVLLYFFWIKPSQEKFQNSQNSIRLRVEPPPFFAPHPADFSFRAMDKGGQPVDFKAYRGRVVVLNIWATWCNPCMAELPSLGKLAAHYSADKDVAVVCLSQETARVIFRNAKAIESGAPLYSLDGQQLPEVYQTHGIPATFIIDKRGMVAYEHLGTSDWAHASVIKFIDALKQRSNKDATQAARLDEERGGRFCGVDLWRRSKTNSG
jgi:thiol-disulfide isomerase/thioredoxin